MSDSRPQHEGHFLDHPEVAGLWHQVINGLLAESDRGAVLVGMSYVDVNLRKLFEAIAPTALGKRGLARTLNYPGPLSTFAARAQVAFLCRLIGPNLYDAIEALREIRNTVAHKPDEFVLANHRDRLETILNLGPDMPGWINKMACELLGRSFVARAAGIKLPDSDEPFFATPEDVAKYVRDKPDLIAPLNEKLPRCELAIGIVFICALLVHDREAAVQTCGSSRTWSQFEARVPNQSAPLDAGQERDQTVEMRVKPQAHAIERPR